MKKTITVDFHDTLCFYDAIEDYYDNKHLVKILNKLSKNNYDIIIVTAGNKAQHGKDINDFIKRNNLDIKTIYYTNGQMKGKLLKKLNSLLHIDNDLEQLKSCEDSGIKTTYLRRF